MLLFLNISGGEILVILVVVYLVFGPKKIPELARMLGKGINEMRRATNEIKNEITREVSSVTKDINLDIDAGDPLGIKKTINETMNPKKDTSGSRVQTTGGNPKDKAQKGMPETKQYKQPVAGKSEDTSVKKTTAKKESSVKKDTPKRKSPPKKKPTD